MADQRSKFNRKARATEHNVDVLNFGVNESDVSIIQSIDSPTKRPEGFALGENLDRTQTINNQASYKELTNPSNSRENAPKSNKSRHKQLSFSVKHNFEEDKKSQRSSARSIDRSGRLKNQELKRNHQDMGLLRRYSDESDGSYRDDSMVRFDHMSNAYDDSYQISNLVAQKTSYLNIMTIGASHLGKFNFIEFFFEKCFNKKIRVDPEIRKVREFVHELNSRQLRRVITIIHTQGYGEEYPMQEWYRNLKHYITEKMDTFDELRKIWHKDKKLQRQTVMDCRVHLCLYFIESPTISVDETVYIRKLSKYVNIMPVLVETRIGRLIDYDDIKHRVKRDLELNEINWFDLQEHDLTFKNFREALIAGTTPFFIAAPKGKLRTAEGAGDLNVLIKMLITPYINTFYYKTEVLWNLNIEKIREGKIRTDTKAVDSKKEGKSSVSLGLALGLGFLGAVVALKNKII